MRYLSTKINLIKLVGVAIMAGIFGVVESCSKNPACIDESTVHESVLLSDSSAQILADAIVIMYADVHDIHDVGPCWPRFWERKYRVRVDVHYRYHIDKRLPSQPRYYLYKFIVLNGYSTYFGDTTITPGYGGWIHLYCGSCWLHTVAYTCKINNPIITQIKFEFIGSNGRSYYTLWSNVYRVPILKGTKSRLEVK